jgi:hypothetical protein
MYDVQLNVRAPAILDSAISPTGRSVSDRGQADGTEHLESAILESCSSDTDTSRN